MQVKQACACSQLARLTLYSCAQRSCILLLIHQPTQFYLWHTFSQVLVVPEPDA